MLGKSEILKRFGVESLSLIKDEDIILIARNGELGNITESSALTSWPFGGEHSLAEHIRRAIELGKELSVSILEGEHLSKDKIIIEFI